MKGRLPRQKLGTLAERKIAPNTSGSRRGTTRLRRCALRDTPSFMGPPREQIPAYLYSGSAPRRGLSASVVPVKVVFFGSLEAPLGSSE
ncbi:hypothetical protein AVEN_248191-1 [Araneus ventricosus]|uniref:Uncharacterized protein n=1 Tax=Araneus ventricosus TaxID=182803 RepID=A0A4Y2VLG5_ARAVE|nr:hypothetical protein AVEN_248191-1 [Araneus ventricosus]